MYSNNMGENRLPYGPYTCKQHYVWREAVPGDFVCVLPQARDETSAENALGPSRRQPGGGAYGPDTCKQGFVWRETRPSDHVCVPPHRRERAKVDNALAPYTMAYPPAAPSNGIRVGQTRSGGKLLYTVQGTFTPNGQVAFYAYGAYPDQGLLLLNKFPADANGQVYGIRDNAYWFAGIQGVIYAVQCNREGGRAPIIVVDEKTGIVSNAGEVTICQ